MKTILSINYQTAIASGDQERISISYSNELGELSNSIKNISDLTDDEIQILTAFQKIANDELTTISPKIARVKLVQLKNRVFSIEGEVFKMKTISIDELSEDSPSQKAVAEALYDFVLQATGVPLETLEAPFGTGKVIINGTTMDYATVASQSGNILSNATQLVIDLFNI